MEIYTIGHSNYDLSRLVDMLNKYNINCVVDIRGIPYSKYNVQYNKETIQKTLNDLGFTYIYMAKEFAAKRDNKISYNKEGYADFHKVINEESFKNGIERLKVGISKGYRIALLGAMQEPVRCHRSILVGRELEKYGFKVNHILHDYSICDQREIENMLLDKYFKDRGQITIDSLIGNEKSEEEMIEEGYDLANKEIGYRMENLK
ncbi:DUF488 domain-containing protein [Clostridium perfringens]|uniref:DUF488 domain-containing protein n=1 Tax=Clostridium perfringens TaxID=1502 RepID=UPI0022486E65|nr:DUF488 domain-containing protein [Clostridium perfringens]MCX0395361.1 DUF488 domain-containing protein [Clostridium perfringens]